MARRFGLALAASLTAASLWAWSPPPTPIRFVTDGAELLSPSARDSLDARLAVYEKRTGHQVLVWTARSLEGEAPEDFASRTFAAWKVGRKGIDDGLVLFIFKDDRKIRFEVGYGLEERLPDAIASRIIREEMEPRLHSGDTDGAVFHGVGAALQAIGGEVGGEVVSRPVPTRHRRPVSPLQTVFLVVLGIVALLFLLTHPTLALQLLWLLASESSGGGGGGGGGYSGGGGRSGGGGATGSW